VKDTTAVIEHTSVPKSAGDKLFSIDPGLMIWTWIIFGLLLVILRKFAWKPMMDSVQNREKVISDAVLQAQKTKEELEKIAETQRELMKKASEEAQRIIDSGKSAAESVAQSVQDKAAEDAKQTLEHAREQITMEKERALREIKEQSVEIIIAASEKLINESLDDDGHKRIVKKHLEEL
jgi:F-type H+-transporting ATPase subunit b